MKLFGGKKKRKAPEAGSEADEGAPLTGVPMVENSSVGKAPAGLADDFQESSSSLETASRSRLLEIESDESDVTATFAELGVCSWLVDSCELLGIRSPTPVQRCCIPVALRGQDVMGLAETGSGKTAAFALPMLQKLSEDPYGIFGLVLTPTRELAIQIAEQVSALGAPMSARVCTVIGGVNMTSQSLELSSRPHIVIATPGRFIDHLEVKDRSVGSLPRWPVMSHVWLEVRRR
jgi:superfamily II DNA/RNA helicase